MNVKGKGKNVKIFSKQPDPAIAGLEEDMYLYILFKWENKVYTLLPHFKLYQFFTMQLQGITYILGYGKSKALHTLRLTANNGANEKQTVVNK